jgi:hypothetical protein
MANSLRREQEDRELLAKVEYLSPNMREQLLNLVKIVAASTITKMADAPVISDAGHDLLAALHSAARTAPLHASCAPLCSAMRALTDPVRLPRCMLPCPQLAVALKQARDCLTSHGLLACKARLLVFECCHCVALAAHHHLIVRCRTRGPLAGSRSIDSVPVSNTGTADTIFNPYGAFGGLPPAPYDVNRTSATGYETAPPPQHARALDHKVVVYNNMFSDKQQSLPAALAEHVTLDSAHALPKLSSTEPPSSGAHNEFASLSDLLAGPDFGAIFGDHQPTSCGLRDLQKLTGEPPCQ